MKILVIHGPNLNLTGVREIQIYGEMGLDEINQAISEESARLGVEVDIRQSNSEDRIVEWIQEAGQWIDAVVINPAGLGYSSISIRDALAILKCPVIEVHLSNIHAREIFRRHTMISEIASGQICGFGYIGYICAIQAAVLLAEDRQGK